MDPSPVSLYMIIGGVLVAFAVMVARRSEFATTGSNWQLCVASLPALVLLCLVYSLAAHMYHSLGGWPNSIGNRGFPDRLLHHAEVTRSYFGAILVATTFAWPPLFVLCLLIRRWRLFVRVLVAYAVACYLCFIAILCAPSKFLNWWWD